MGIEVFGELFKEGRFTLNDLRLLEISIIENYLKTKYIPYNPYLDMVDDYIKKGLGV